MHSGGVCAEFLHDGGGEGTVFAAVFGGGFCDGGVLFAVEHAGADFEHLVASGAEEGGGGQGC